MSGRGAWKEEVARTPISVIIPTRDGGAPFLKLLEGIRSQEGVGAVELIVLDSQSEDGTAEAAARAGARLIPVERAAFNHGAVRDQGARTASGGILVFTVQDACPADAFWLCHLAAPLLAPWPADPGAEGATAEPAGAASSRILPRPGAHPLARRTVLSSPMASPEPHGADPARLDLAALSPEALRYAARFDDVSSAIRADVYAKVPFRPVSMSEDLVFALDALRAGVRLAFAPRSVVYHSHEYGLSEVFRRYRDDAAALKAILGLRARRSALHALRGWAFEVRKDISFLAREGVFTCMRYGVYAGVFRAFQLAGQWRGSA